jgi:plasmid maintenance system antidote protein VapI
MSEAADVLGVRRATLSDLINAKGALPPKWRCA